MRGPTQYGYDVEARALVDCGEEVGSDRSVDSVDGSWGVACMDAGMGQYTVVRFGTDCVVRMAGGAEPDGTAAEGIGDGSPGGLRC